MTMFSNSRSFREYCLMFRLTSNEIGGSFLDCGAGGASFIATQRQLNSASVAVDPTYGLWPDQSAPEAVTKGINQATVNVLQESDRYEWGHVFDNPHHHRSEREASMRTFLLDYRLAPAAYVGGGADSLPFADAQFDFTVSSHLLFINSDVISAAEHVFFIEEMLRVARSEVRIFPIVRFTDEAPDLINPTINALESAGHECTVSTSRYRFLSGADQMLVVR